MNDRKRLMIEIGAALLLVLACWAVWSFARARNESAADQLRQACDARAQKLATSQAEAVFRAFAAGVQGNVLGQRKDMLEMAKGDLLRLPYVAFVHVLAPDGRVLASSNEKYSVAGKADDRAAWALQATGLQTRTGDLPGTVEIAAPVQGSSGKVAVLWLGYKTRELLASADGRS